MKAYFLFALLFISLVVNAQADFKPVPFLDWKDKRFPIEDWVTINGDTLKQSFFEGKICFFNFFEPGCPPCMQEIPYLNRLLKHYADSIDVSVIGFFVGTKHDYLDYFKSEKNLQKVSSNPALQLSLIPIPKYTIVAIDPNLCKYKYNVCGFPSNLILDKNGIVRYIMPGFHVIPSMKEKYYFEYISEIDKLR